MTARSRRILHVIGSIAPGHGGTSVVIYNTLKALRRRGVLVDVATTDGDGPGRAAVPLDRFVELHSQRVRYFPRQTRFYEASAPMLAWLAAHVPHYDLVHTHGLFGFAPVAGARVARTRRVPYVMSPEGTLDKWSRAHRRSALKRASISLVEGPLLRRANRVHFTSKLEVEQAQDVGVRMRPVIVPLGLDLESLPRTPGESRFESQLQSVGRGPLVLYLSRIAPKKGLDILLKAFSLTVAGHPGATLLIAGDGPPGLVAGYKALARELGLISPRIEWLGFVQGADKSWLLQRASVFVLPSKSENFCFAAAEAIAAGVPVVLTDAVALAEQVRAAGCGLVTDGSAEDTHRAMTSLLANDAMRLEMGAAGARLAGESLTLDAFGRRLEELYETVIAEHSTRADRGLHASGVQPR